MTGELRHLRRGHGADPVAAVVEDEPLGAGHAVTSQPQAHFRRQRLEHGGVAHRRWRAEHERLRPGDMTAGVSVRTAYIAEEQVVRPELPLEPVDVDDRGQLRHGRETHAGRS